LILSVEWAELEVIDLAKAKTPEGKAELVIKARDAMHRQGFFYIINHGLEKDQVRSVLSRCSRIYHVVYTLQIERVFNIAAVPFTQVDPEEKKVYEAKIKETGTFMGYKPLQYWVKISLWQHT